MKRNNIKERLLAPAKINLFLKVSGLRKDGYHEILSLMVCFPLYDAMNVILSEGQGEIEVVCPENREIEGERNLVFHATQQFFRETGKKFNLSVSIEKNIPLGSGLGGSSSDAAEILLFLNRNCKKPLSGKKLIVLASRIGSDCPFFIFKKPSIISGRGEIIDNLSDFKSLPVLLAVPRTSISTAQVYKEFDLTPDKKSDRDLCSLKREHIISFKNIEEMNLGNDLESITAKHVPLVSFLKEKMLEHNAVQAHMSGSGPAVFGIFHDLASAADVLSRIVRETDSGDIDLFAGKTLL
jgi:4-diphosphocytidyl-2-C-methyl-D-erythritol kinase